MTKRQSDSERERVDGETSDSEPRSQDVVLLHSRTEDGQGLRALRARRERLEMTEIRPLQEGKPLAAGEVVRLRPRPRTPLICDVEVMYGAAEGAPAERSAEAEVTPAGHGGPPCVASESYRRNWEAVFGKRPSKGDTGLN